MSNRMREKLETKAVKQPELFDRILLAFLFREIDIPSWRPAAARRPARGQLSVGVFAWLSLPSTGWSGAAVAGAGSTFTF